MRAEEEGAEKHYLKQKWRQNPPVRSILLLPPPPPFHPLPHRGRREPSGVPATRGSRHRASPAQVGKRPFFTKKKKNKTSRTETATTLPLGGQPPKSSPKLTRRGKLAPQRPFPELGARGGVGVASSFGRGSEGRRGECAGQSPRPHLGRGNSLPSARSLGKGRPELPQLGRHGEERRRRGTPVPRHFPPRSRRARAGRKSRAAGQREGE